MEPRHRWPLPRRQRDRRPNSSSPATSPTHRISATPFAAACSISSIRASGSPSASQYDTGLPFEFDGDPDTVLAEYGQQVLDRINFDRGRIDPTFQLNASAGADLFHSEKITTRLQIDAQNLTNVLDVIDFGGLFSGNAIGPSRSVLLRLTSTF